MTKTVSMGNGEGTNVGHPQCIQAKLPIPDFGLIVYFDLTCYTEDRNHNSNAIGYVTSNFIGPLHLQVRVNCMC
jgi:hypothetical protein